MGFFSDLKEDLSQAVNELMPEEAAEMATEQEEVQGDALQEAEPETDAKETAVDEEETAEQVEATVTKEDTIAEEAVTEEETSEGKALDDDLSLEEMLKNIDAIQISDENMNTVENKGAEKKMDSYTSRAVSDETSIITSGMMITGDISSEGSVEVIGTINGNIDILGKLNVTGYITGNSKAAEIYAEGAKINGEIVSEGAVKIGASSVVIGNIIATSAAIAGAVKGDIDVKGPVILDASAIVMGNIKSKSVQINNGAVIEGMCSQCYADVNPTSFFDDYKPETKKAK